MLTKRVNFSLNFVILNFFLIYQWDIWAVVHRF